MRTLSQGRARAYLSRPSPALLGRMRNWEKAPPARVAGASVRGEFLLIEERKAIDFKLLILLVKSIFIL